MVLDLEAGAEHDVTPVPNAATSMGSDSLGNSLGTDRNDSSLCVPGTREVDRTWSKNILTGRAQGITAACNRLLEDISGAPHPLLYSLQDATASRSGSAGQKERKPRGVFHRAHTNKEKEKAPEVAQISQGKTGDFMQRLRVLLTTDEATRAAAIKAYERFDGDMARLPGVLQILEERWGFPESVFPLLQTHLRRSKGFGEELTFVTEQEWIQAFIRWLHVLNNRIGKTKVSRQCFVQTRTGAELEKDYLKGEVLGHGTYGEVRMVLHTALGVARVVKSVPKAQLGLEEDQVEDEVNLLKALDHPNIVRIFEAFETEDMLQIVMDYAAGGDLSSVIRDAQAQRRKIAEKWVVAAARQITAALEYMHSQGVIHCDLKPGNVMLLKKLSLDDVESGSATPHVLLVDFGLAEIFEEKEEATGNKPVVKGTPAYLAPEGFEGRATHKTDMWALGVIVYEMMAGDRPFRKTTNIFMLFSQVANSEPPWDAIAPTARDLVQKLMDKDPHTRLSATECGEHQWFKEHDTERMELFTSSASKGAVPKVLGQGTYFQRAVMFCIGTGMGAGNGPGQDMQALFDAFQAMDMDRSGRLTVEELRRGLHLLGIQQHAAQLMPILDLDQDGHISYTEFIAGALRMEGEVVERLLRFAFREIDLDGDGFIDMRELQNLLSCNGAMGQSTVLPDGQTVERVMEIVSCGEGRISFPNFSAHMTTFDKAAPAVMKPGDKDSCIGSTSEASTHPRDAQKELLKELEKSLTNGTIARSEHTEMFPAFHDWMAELYEDSRRGAAFKGFLLRFSSTSLEATYVAHYRPTTCRQISLLGFLSVCYSVYSLLFEYNLEWEPSFTKWYPAAHVANTLSWVVLATCGLLVMLYSSQFRKHHDSGRSQAVSGSGTAWTKAHGAAGAGEESDALHTEHLLTAWGCFVPWVSCCFANRFRVATLFNTEPTEVFATMNSDYDLIMTMLGTLMFFSMRTQVRFQAVLLMNLSCIVAYFFTSILLGVADPRCDTGHYGNNWAWPGLLMTLISMLGLSGHYSVEYSRRLTFLSLHASYTVLSEAQDEDPSVADLLGEAEGAPKGATRAARLKRSASLVRRFADSGDMLSRPLRQALTSVAHALEETHRDVVEAERLHVVDIPEVLHKKGIDGAALENLLLLLNEVPAVDHSSDAIVRKQLSSRSGQLGQEAWGWDALPSGSEKEQRALLQGVADAVLLPAARLLPSCGSRSMEQKARDFLQILLAGYDQAPRGSLARAVLATRVVHWIGRRIGLCSYLEPCEQLGLVLAAIGLHCQSGKAHSGGALIGGDPLLRHTTGINRTLEALDASGLSEVPVGSSNGQTLRHLVRQLLVRAQPSCALLDASRVRARSQLADQLLETSPVDRALVSGLVLAAADFSFLALPPLQHRPWAELAQAQGPPGMNVAAWLCGLVDVVGLPLFEALSAIEGAEEKLRAPLQNLHSNSRHWRTTSVVSPAAAPPEVVAEKPLSEKAEGKVLNGLSDASTEEGFEKPPWIRVEELRTPPNGVQPPQQHPSLPGAVTELPESEAPSMSHGLPSTSLAGSEVVDGAMIGLMPSPEEEWV